MNKINLTLVKYDFISTQNFEEALTSSLKRRLKDSQIKFDSERNFLIDNEFYTYHYMDVYKNGYITRCAGDDILYSTKDYFNGMLNSELDYIKIDLIACEKSSEEIIEYIKSITTEENTPAFFLYLIEKDNSVYTLKKLKVSEILEMDKDVKEYVDVGEDRYKESENALEELFYPIVIHKGKVFDGWNRILKHFIRGLDVIDVWISKEKSS